MYTIYTVTLYGKNCWTYLVERQCIFRIIITNFFSIVYFQSASSPRRVAVPVLVKDGKPCSGASSVSQPQSHTNSSTNSGNNSNNSNGNANGGAGAGAAGAANVPGGLNLIPADAPNSHSPDTSSSLIASYGGTVGGSNAAMLQQPCNNALMSNSLAMAYRNQNNFISNGHQQQCGGYLPLQGRAW